MYYKKTMLIYIHGEDTVRSRAYLVDQIERFRTTRDPGGYNTSVFNARELSLEQLVRELTAAPFLAERRLVVLKNLLSADKDLVRACGERIRQGVPESTNLIVWQGESLGKGKEVKEVSAFLEKAPYVQDFPLLKGKDLYVWVQNYIEKRGGKTTPGALAALTEMGGDMEELVRILDQTIAYGHGMSLTTEVVQLFTVSKTNETIFSLIDALVSGKTSQALKLLTERRAVGDEDGQIFGLLIWNIRLVLSLADLLVREPGIISDRAAEEMGINSFVARKNWSLVQRVPRDVFRDMFERLLDIDRQVKTGAASLPLLVELFAARSSAPLR